MVIGSPDAITVNGAFTQASSGVLDLQLGGSPASSQYGSLTISGAADLAGTLKADLVNGYVPSTTDSFTPITFASESGGFSSFVLPSGSGYQFAGAVSFTNVLLSAAPSTAVTTTVNAAASLHAVAANTLGVNTAYWDSDAVTSQTEQMTSAAGLGLYRFPGGSASDEFHFNVADQSRRFRRHHHPAVRSVHLVRRRDRSGHARLWLGQSAGSGRRIGLSAGIAQRYDADRHGNRVALRRQRLDEHELGHGRLLGLASRRDSAGPRRRPELSPHRPRSPLYHRSNIGKSATRSTEVGRPITTARPVPAG